MIPIWMLVARAAKSVADNQNSQIDNFNKNQQYSPNGKQLNNFNMNRNSGNGTFGTGLGNAFSTFSSIYGNYLMR